MLEGNKFRHNNYHLSNVFNFYSVYRNMILGVFLTGTHPVGSAISHSLEVKDRKTKRKKDKMTKNQES